MISRIAAAVPALRSRRLRDAAQAARARSYEPLRKTNNIQEASKKSPDLVAGAEKLADEVARGVGVERPRGIAARRHHGEHQAQDRAGADGAGAAEGEDRRRCRPSRPRPRRKRADLAEKLANENEKLALLQKYVEARKAAEADKQRLSAQMTSEQQKAQAEQERLALQLASEQKIAAAQLALRTADTVDASKFAKAEYSAASDMLAKASAELKQNDYAGAQASAEVAKKNADKATEIAKPLYEQAEQTSQNKARDEALARDASAISGRRRAPRTARRSAAPGDRRSRQLFSKRKPGHRPRPRRRPGRRSPS